MFDYQRKSNIFLCFKQRFVKDRNLHLFTVNLKNVQFVITHPNIKQGQGFVIK